MSTQYLGENKVKEIVVAKETTPGGQEVSEVTFESGKKGLVPTFFLKQILSEQAVPTADFINNQMNVVAQSMLSVMLEHNVRLADVGRLIDKLVLSVNQNLRSADAILWGKNEEDKTMMDLHRLLIENKVTLKDLLGGK